MGLTLNSYHPALDLNPLTTTLPTPLNNSVKRDNEDCHNPRDNTPQHNLNTVVEFDMKMTVQTNPPTTTPHHRNSTVNTRGPQINFNDQHEI